MNLLSLFDQSFVGRRDAPALEWVDGTETSTFSFGDVDARASRMAHALVARGLTAGDRLCVQLPNGLHFLDLFLACTRLGVIFVPVNVLYQERELRHILRDAEPKALITATGEAPVSATQVSIWDAPSLGDDARRERATRSEALLDGDTPAVIVYTSGTTGAAKGAVLSHANLAANGAAVVDAWRITSDDRYLAVLPLFHVHGLGNGVHAWLLSGCLMRLVERFDHRQAAELFRDFTPTLFFGVPTISHRLLDPSVMPDEAARAVGAKMRLFVSGSAPLPPAVLETFRERYGHTILERYGMTETLMIATNPLDGERRAGTVGKPFPGVSVRIVDERGRSVGDGTVGEVQVQSPSLFGSYWRNETATRSAFSAGWFRTGDLGMWSSDGYLTLRGRRGDLIISGGFNIYPREVEEVLLEDSAVREVVVVGVPDEARGEVPVAYVVTDAELDTAQLARRCREQLASFKVPRAFVRVDALPRTALGKIQRHLLPDWKQDGGGELSADRSERAPR